jgi:hypothetical protein
MSAGWTDLHSMGRVLYDFSAGGQFQIDLKKEEMVEVMKQSSGWFRGRVVGREARGIFPVSFIELLPNEPFPTTAAAPPTPKAQPPPPVQQTQPATVQQPAAVTQPVAVAQPAAAPVAASTPAATVASSPSSVANSPFRQAQALAAANAAGAASPTGAPTGPAPPRKQWPAVQPAEADTKGETPPAASPAPAPAAKQWPPPPPNTGGAKAPPPPPPAAASPTAAASPQTPARTVPPPPPPARIVPPASPASSSSSAGPLGSPTHKNPSANSTQDFRPGHRFSITEAQKPRIAAAVDTSKVVEESESKLKDNMSLESLLVEIDHTVREWTTAMRQGLVLGNMVEYHRGMERLSALLECRRRLQLEENESARAAIRHEIIEMIEGSRKMAEGYMVPRNAAGQVADSNNTGVVELLELHRSMYSALTQESSSVWMQKGHERKLKSFKKQEAELLRSAAMIPSSPSAANLPAPPTPSSASSSESGRGSIAAVSAPSTSGKKFPPGQLQLFLNVKMCIFAVGEATELLFSLYSEGEQRFITEDYSLALSDQGLPINLSLLHKMRTVFRDLTAKDFASDLWLVCRIYRKGRLVFDTAKAKSPQRLYRRPFGCAACSLTESGIDGLISTATSIKEFEPQNSAMTIYTCADESKFSQIHQMIISKDKALEPAPRAKGIALGLILYTGELDALRKTVEDMSEPDTPSTRKLRFPDRMNPADLRNDLYLHIGSALYSQDGKKSAKNIELSVRVVTDDGVGVENCISYANSDKTPVTEYHSTVFYHLNTPFYGETIRVNVPNDLLDRCHLFISFWHVSTSKKISCFSFSYLPLTTELGAVMPDAEYKLCTYKCFPKIEEYPKQGGAFYLLGDQAKPKLEARKEYLVVRTQSLSTFKTQNLILHSIFTHKKDPSGMQVKALMERFIAGMGKESTGDLVRFLRELFNTLFSMILTPSYSASHSAIFKGILHALTLLTDKKNPQPTWEMITEYISLPSLFSHPSQAAIMSKLHYTLVKYMKEIVAEGIKATREPGAVSTQPPDHSLLKLTKSLSYLFKLLIKSREIEVSIGAGQGEKGDSEFKRNIQELLSHFMALIGAPSRDELSGVSPGSPLLSSTQYILPSQTYLVRSLPESIGDLLKIFGRKELAEQMRDVIKALPQQSIQNVNKLNLIRNILLSSLGDFDDSRAILFPVVIENLMYHLLQINTGGLGEPYVCISILNHMLDVVSKSQMEIAAAAGGVTDARKLDQFIPLLKPIVQVALKIQQNARGVLSLKQPSESILSSIALDVVVDSITILWTLLSLLNKTQIESFIASLGTTPQGVEGLSDLQSFLLDFLSLCSNSLQSHCYPDMWIVMNMMECQIMGKMVKHISVPIRAKCIQANVKPAPDSLSSNPNHRIIRAFLELIVDMLQYDQLKIEYFPQRKKVFVKERYGDVRGALIEEFLTVWNVLGQEKMVFIELFLITKLFELARGGSGKDEASGGAPKTIKPSSSDPDESAASQSFALNMYFDMIASSYLLNKSSTGVGKGESFTQVERHTIDALYNLANLNQEAGRKLMEQIYTFVSQKFHSSSSSSTEGGAELSSEGMSFLNHIHRMYELMSSLLKFPDTSLFEDERTSVALKLMSYLENSGHSRKEMYQVYVTYLVDLHLSLKNYSEAGCTAIQGIKILSWTADSWLGPLNSTLTKYPSERERERKEKMYLAAISYFKQGEEWERAIQYGEELRNYYQFASFEYLKLSALLTDQSECFRNILTQERFYSNYFRVCYFGSGFDEELTGALAAQAKGQGEQREFVYRGVKLEPVMGE